MQGSVIMFKICGHLMYIIGDSRLLPCFFLIEVEKEK